MFVFEIFWGKINNEMFFFIVSIFSDHTDTTVHYCSSYLLIARKGRNAEIAGPTLGERSAAAQYFFFFFILLSKTNKKGNANEQNDDV